MNKHRMNKELSSFAVRLRGLIANRQSAIGNRQFSELALELFALQFDNNAAFRKICEARGLTPGVVEHWTQIPAVLTGAFKELELTSIPPDERTAVFHSSGTTEQKPSRHFHNAESLAVYEASLWNWFEQNLFSNCELLVLTPPPKLAPHSSLVHMFETIRQNLGAPESVFFGQIDTEGVWTLDFITALAALNGSLELKTQNSRLILGTAFSFVHLLDYLVERNLRVELPAGSRVMETGGYKNRSRSMPKTELHALITERLGVSPKNIICEYGMSELSSQAYAPGAPASSRRVSANPMELAGWKPALPVISERVLILLQIGFDAGDDAFELNQLPARERRLVARHQIGQLPAQAALAVHEAAGVAEFFAGDLRLIFFLEMRLELADFLNPMFKRVGIISLVRQFEDIHRFAGAHQLEHFLFAVAGCLGDNQLRPVQKRIVAGDMITEGGFDERTQVGRQELFRRGDGRARTAAKADRHGAGGQNDFAGRELAQDAHDRPALRLGGFGVIVAVVNHAGEPGQRFRQSFCARGG